MKTHMFKKLIPAFLLCFVSSQVYAGYTITLIADTSSAHLDDFVDASADINNSGTVVFRAENTANLASLYLSDDISTAILVDVDNDFNSAPVISDNGTVVIARDGSTVGLYDVTASSFIVDDGSSVYESFGDVAINSIGVVSFAAGFNNDADTAISTALPLTTIEDTTGSLAELSISDINDSGVVTYVAEPDAGGNLSLYSSASSTAIFSAANIISAVINNSGTIAYTDGSNVYSNAGGTLISGGGTFASFNKIAINNNDDIAVSGVAAGSSAIYVRNSSGVLEKVIATVDGDILGNALQGVGMSQSSINDAGQVVFWAASVDLTTFTLVEGLYLATPDPVLLLGDIDVDGDVDTADLLLMNQFILGLKTPTATELNAADMNQDAVLTAGDLVIHSRTVLGLI